MPDPNEAAEPPGRFLRMPAVLARTGFSRSTLYRKLANGTFPKQIQISERCVAWSDADITAWLRETKYGVDV